MKDNMNIAFLESFVLTFMKIIRDFSLLSYAFLGFVLNIKAYDKVNI